MKIVIMDEELHEPLTVVEIPHWLAEMAKKGTPIRLSPPTKMDYSVAVHAADQYSVVSCVTLRFERVCRTNPRTRLAEILFWYAYADDPETALLLRAAYLPGQVGDVQRRESEAFFRGIFAGMAL
jgi:hypothetical protein